MSVKEFLQGGRNLHFEIGKLKQLKQQHLDDATARGIDYSGERVQGFKANVTEEKNVTYADFSQLLDLRILELEEYRAKILLLINQYPDTVGRSLLLMRYIECLSWEKIAEELHYELRWAQRLHGKILVELERSHKKP